jgi:hypothetical protein
MYFKQKRAAQGLDNFDRFEAAISQYPLMRKHSEILPHLICRRIDGAIVDNVLEAETSHGHTLTHSQIHCETRKTINSYNPNGTPVRMSLTTFLPRPKKHDSIFSAGTAEHAEFVGSGFSLPTLLDSPYAAANASSAALALR